MIRFLEKLAMADKKEANNKKAGDDVQKRMPVQKLTFGQVWADKVTGFCGSWTFISIFFVYMAIWMALDIILIKYWDPYPFILLNLTLSCLAAIQAPLILMSQNRANERDRLRSERDYLVDRKAEREIQNIKKDIGQIKNMIIKLRK